MFMKFRLIIFALLLWMQSLFALEITPADTTNILRFELETIRIVAPGNSESIGKRNVIYLDNTIKSHELYLADLLKNVAGLNISTGSRGESNLKIRGFRRESVKIMIDGRTVNGGYFGFVNLAEMPIFDLAEVHIVKGAVSSLYGSNSSGGVVNFVSRRPPEDSWLTLKSSIQRNNTQNWQLISAHSFYLWDYWINFSGSRTKGFALSKGFEPTAYQNTGIRTASENSSMDIQSKFNFSFFDVHSAGISLGYSFADVRNVPSSIYEQMYRRFQDWKRWQISGMGNLNFTDRLVLQPQLSYDVYNNVYQEFRDADYKIKTYDSILESWSFTPQLRTQYRVNEKNKIYHLAKFERETYNRKDDREYPDWTTNYTNLYQTSMLYYHQFNDVWQISGAFGLSQSARYYYQQDTKNLSKTASSDNSSASRQHRQTLKTAWYSEPALSLQYQKTLNSINFALSRNIQYPILRHLYSLSRGNLTLMPERVIKAEINFRQLFVGDNYSINLENSLYYNIIDGLIDRVNSSHYQNQSQQQNRGVELSLITKSGKHFTTEHQLNYIDLRMNKHFQFTETPEWSGTNTLSYSFSYPIKLSYHLHWYGDMQSPDNTGKLHTLPAKTLHDLSWIWELKLNKYRISASITNITDLNYAEEYGYPAAGIGFSLNIEWVVF